MQYEGVGFTVDVKNYILLNGVLVVDHKLLTSGTNLVNSVKEIAVD
jgi:hypothetical protein